MKITHILSPLYLLILLFVQSANAEVCSFYWEPESAANFTPAQKSEVERQLFVNGRRFVRVRDPKYAELRFSLSSGDGGIKSLGDSEVYLQGISIRFANPDGHLTQRVTKRYSVVDRPIFENVLEALNSVIPCEQTAHVQY